MIGLKITKTVSLSLSAEQWELYTASKPLQCECAAEKLNRVVEFAVNQGWDRFRVRAAVWPVFVRHAELGATDSEPVHILNSILNEVFHGGAL